MSMSDVSKSNPAQQTILVVDDEILVRMVVADYLRECGYKVIEAASADEALLILHRTEIAIDIVFSDVEMPGSMDGFALSSWLRQNRPELDIILTGTLPRVANSAAALCDEGPIPKPYAPQSVVERIRRLIAVRDTRRSE